MQAHEDAAHGRGFSAAQDEVPAVEGEPLAQDLGELAGPLGRERAQAANIGLGIGAPIVGQEHGAERRLRGWLGGRRLSPGDGHQCQQDAQHSRHVSIPLPRFS